MDWTAKEQNGKVTVCVTRPMDNSGLFRAYALGAGGARCLLGALTPSGGCLTLRRTLSADALRQRGCYPIAGVEAVLAHPFALPFPDDILKRAFAASPGGCPKADGDGFTLTFPYDPSAPFPMTPIFCFARVFCQDRRPYLCYAFDKDGYPRLPPAHNSGEL